MSTIHFHVMTRNMRTGHLVMWLLSIGLPLLALPASATRGEGPARAEWDHIEAQRQASSAQMQGGAVDSAIAQSGELEPLLQYARAHNAALRSAFANWKAALERVPQVSALPDPQLAYAYFIESVETRVGPQRQKLSLEQKIPLFGKLGLRGEAAVSLANAQGALYEQQRRELDYRLTKLWNQYWFLHRSIAITQDNVRLMTYLESVALSQYRTGRSPHSAVIRAQVELGILEDRLRTLQDRQHPFLAEINAELNRPTNDPIAIPTGIDDREDSITMESVVGRLTENNPKLLEIAFRIEYEKARVKLAGKNTIPDLSLGFEYVFTGDALISGVSDSGKNAAIIKASFNLPLWLGKHGAERAEARARKLSIVESRQQLVRQLEAQLESVLFELRDATRRADLYKTTLLPKGRQSLEVIEDAFATGDADFLDLIDAQRTLLEFELALEKVRSLLATRNAELHKLVGSAPVSEGFERSVKP